MAESQKVFGATLPPLRRDADEQALKICLPCMQPPVDAGTSHSPSRSLAKQLVYSDRIFGHETDNATPGAVSPVPRRLNQTSNFVQSPRQHAPTAESDLCWPASPMCNLRFRDSTASTQSLQDQFVLDWCHPFMNVPKNVLQGCHLFSATSQEGGASADSDPPKTPDGNDIQNLKCFSRRMQVTSSEFAALRAMSSLRARDKISCPYPGCGRFHTFGSHSTNFLSIPATDLPDHLK